MKERPILFSGPMVRAILDGRKTMTRRVVKPQPLQDLAELAVEEKYGQAMLTYRAYPGRGTARHAICECPYGAVGDRLWVREAFIPCVVAHSGCPISEASYVRYRDGCQKMKASGNVYPWTGLNPPKWDGYKFRPSTHMPRWASRITLEITGVRVERLQEITEADAEQDGYDPIDGINYGFRPLWDQLNGPRGFGWDVNPWVWVLQFRRVGP